MKKLLVLLISLTMLLNFSYSQSDEGMKKTKEIIVYTDTTSDRDPNIMVYKCIDTLTNQSVYVDLLEEGFVGFYTNNTLVKYAVKMYSLSTNDTTWKGEYISIIFQDNMPIEVLMFNSNETQITIYGQNKNGKIVITHLTVLKNLFGFSEYLYLKKKRAAPTFIYGDTSIPSYIRYENRVK